MSKKITMEIRIINNSKLQIRNKDYLIINNKKQQDTNNKQQIAKTIYQIPDANNKNKSSSSDFFEVPLQAICE